MFDEFQSQLDVVRVLVYLIDKRLHLRYSQIASRYIVANTQRTPIDSLGTGLQNALQL